MRRGKNPASGNRRSEEARRAELTPEQVACEDELRRIYKSGVIRFKSRQRGTSTQEYRHAQRAGKGSERLCQGPHPRRGSYRRAGCRTTYNKSLSERRAQAIVAYLTGAGVDKGSVVAQGFGEERPIATNDNAEGMAQNRRIEFTVY